MKLKILSAILASALWAANSQAAVWTTTQEWSPKAELAYQKWVKDYWTADFFTKNGWYKNLSVDCAHAAYAMRIIYSSSYGLPFAVSDATGGKSLITNEMNRWDNLTDAQKKRNFLIYVFNLTSTGTVANDTYPVAVNRQTLTSGDILLTDGISVHHTWTVKSIADFGVPYLVYGSLPAAIQMFDGLEWPSMETVFPGGLKPQLNAGFRAFRQPQYVGVPAWKVPGYSLEQYQLPYDTWLDVVNNKLKITDEPAGQKLARILGLACKRSNERAVIVYEGLQVSQKLGHQCMGSADYNNYSTPGRDLRLKAVFKDLEEAYKAALHDPKTDPDEIGYARSTLGIGGAPATFCPVTIAKDVSVTLNQVYQAAVSDQLSNNPNDTLKMRWGLEKFPSDFAKSCPQY